MPPAFASASPLPSAAEPCALSWPLALRTWHAVLEGACSAEDWCQALGEALPERLLIADRDSLAGLPAALAAWGRQRVVVGVTVRCDVGAEGDTDSDDPALADVILVARTASGYQALCRWLSWRNEEPNAWRGWLHGGGDRGAYGHVRVPAPALRGVSVLLRTTRLISRFQALAAQVLWHCDGRTRGPVGLPSAIPALALMVVDHRHGADRRQAVVRQAIAQREGRDWVQASGLDQLPPLSAAWEPLALAGQQFLAACATLPEAPWHLPPSPYGDAPAELRRRAEAGLRRRYRVIDAALTARFEHELAVINAKGFAGYLLTVDDLARGRRTCGRGSGASSLIVYCLGITNVDPQRYGLMFERFLNYARSDPPDLDVDFPWDERDAVLADALHRYGREHVAMVANHCHLRAGSALRVVARAYGQGDAETSAVRDALRGQRRYALRARLNEPWPGILDAAQALQGRPHHSSLHCGGVIITPTPLRDLVPLHPAAKMIDDGQGNGAQPLPVIEWEKDGAEAMGLVKIDLLGNRSLAVVRDTLSDLRADGIHIDEDRWAPADDPLTQSLVASGATIGCFYIESPAMRQLQAKAGSGAFDALVIHSSIIRPAANRWINTYLERLHDFRRHGLHRDEWYPHPCLRQLLSESFGVLSYQEDVMQVAVTMAGFDEVQANALRKALGHWGRESTISQFSQWFRQGAQNRAATAEAIAAVWEMIVSFAGYSFCKAHSASYAMVSFQCAWLKAHFPAYFLARVIANEGGFYQPAAYIEEARRCGVRILGPCVVHSQWRTVREGADALRSGLHLVPGLAASAAQRLISQRQQRPWSGIDDVRCRGQLGAGILDTLARAGALDALHPHYHRGQVLWLARCLGLRPRPRPSERLLSGPSSAPIAEQTTLLDVQPAVDPAPPDLPLPSPASCRRTQWAVLGFMADCHPLADDPPPSGAVSCAAAASARAGQSLMLYVQVIARKQVSARAADPDQHPSPMSFVTLEDASGILESVWFPKVYRRYGPLLESGHPLLLRGTVQREYGFPILQVERVSRG